jgi:molybdate transport repressor ModE-like protein
MESSLGGKGGGGAKLTDEGHKVLKLFRDMELKAQKSLIKEKAIFSKLIS